METGATPVLRALAPGLGPFQLNRSGLERFHTDRSRDF